MKIRPYTPKDKQAVYHIHFETGLFGKSMSALTTQQRRWNKHIAYFLTKEPENAFVAEHNGEVFGYLVSRFEKRNEHLAYVLRTLGLLCALPLMSRHERDYWKQDVLLVLRALRKQAPELTLSHPPGAVELHINLLPQARGQRAGFRLLAALATHAKKHGKKALYAVSFHHESNPTEPFWVKNGFEEHDRVTSTMWGYPVPLVCYVKRLVDTVRS